MANDQDNTDQQHYPLIGAIDQGTSSTRFLVFQSQTGRLLASSQIEIQRIVPKEGWVEIDPNAIMASVYATIGEVHNQMLREGIQPKLSCIGICNQRESTVVWDKETGKPLYNVIVWMDNRTKDLVDNLLDSVPGRDFNWLKDKTGLPMSTYFSAFKLRWLIENVPAVASAFKNKRLRFGTVDSWILWNLTGRHLTDVTNASRTFLIDIETLNWDPGLCKYFNIPVEILPKILDSADDFGSLLHGPFKGVPITGVIGDQSAALLGHNCTKLGRTKATFGTGCFIMQNIGPGPLNGALSGVTHEAKRGLITTVGYKLPNKPACYALEGSIKIAGAALTWLRDNVQLIQNYEECDQLVNKTTHSAGVFFVPALGGLYSPYWDPNAAGLFIGLSQFTRREHMVRATFDSIAFQTNDILSLMRGVTSGLMIDGGLCKSDNLCQILADLTGCDIVRPSMCETSALGAAMIAGCGAGIWPFEEMSDNCYSTNGFSSTANRNEINPSDTGIHNDEKLMRHQIKQLPNSNRIYSSEQTNNNSSEINVDYQTYEMSIDGSYSLESGRVSSTGTAPLSHGTGSIADTGPPFEDPGGFVLNNGLLAKALSSCETETTDRGSTHSSSICQDDDQALTRPLSPANNIYPVNIYGDSQPTSLDPDQRSFIVSKTFPSNLSTCLRRFICSPEKAAAAADQLHDEFEERSRDIEGLDPEDLNACTHDHRPAPSAYTAKIIKPADVFHSYITADHRSYYVETWHRAVERSMQWTKIHHEEVRRIEYQRLSSLPISIYIFASIGMVALSGLISHGCLKS